MNCELLIDAAGNMRCIYDEIIDLDSIGRLAVRRGSQVEPVSDGGWSADLAPVNGPRLGPFPTRHAALSAERDWLSRHWLCPAPAVRAV